MVHFINELRDFGSRLNTAISGERGGALAAGAARGLESVIAPRRGRAASVGETLAALGAGLESGGRGFDQRTRQKETQDLSRRVSEANLANVQETRQFRRDDRATRKKTATTDLAAFEQNRTAFTDTIGRLAETGAITPDQAAVFSAQGQAARPGEINKLNETLQTLIKTKPLEPTKLDRDLKSAGFVKGEDDFQEAARQILKLGDGAGALIGKDKFDAETKLRKELTKANGDFIKVRDSFGRIQASAVDPSPAGDLALIFNYMKMLDPGSTVRESEFATAENAAGVDERVRKTWGKILSGKKLTPNQRKDFIDRANKLFAQQEVFYTDLSQQYTGLAERVGVDPANVVLDLSTGIDRTSVPTITIDLTTRGAP